MIARYTVGKLLLWIYLKGVEGKHDWCYRGVVAIIYYMAGSVRPDIYQNDHIGILCHNIKARIWQRSLF